MRSNAQTATPIGGFFELELPKTVHSYHPNAIALTTGRGCLRLMLKNLKISKCYVPFYSCDVLYEPFLLESVDLEFYGLNHLLEPAEYPSLNTGEYFLYINYFGIQSAAVDRLIDKYGDNLIIDNTHSFFHQGYKNNWSFTCARKYFGVPDGAYLYSPFKISENLKRFDAVSITPNVLRLLGRQAESFEEYKKYENSLDSEIYAMSVVSERLLSLVDYEQVKKQRKENFHFLHTKLKELNEIRIAEDFNDTPFAYPFLPEALLDKREFYKDDYFIPSLWLDPANRKAKGFEFDKQLGIKLLPLPIDHRYNTEDMEKLIGKIKELL